MKKILIILIILLITSSISYAVPTCSNPGKLKTYILEDNDGMKMKRYVIQQNRVDLMQKTKEYQTKTFLRSKYRYYSRLSERHTDRIKGEGY